MEGGGVVRAGGGVGRKGGRRSRWAGGGETAGEGRGGRATEL